MTDEPTEVDPADARQPAQTHIPEQRVESAPVLATMSVPTESNVSDNDGGRSLERLIFFSDAVIAIALTLLALDLPLPEGSSNAAMWHSVGALMHHDYQSFALSFIVIGAFWTGHHKFFGLVGRVDTVLIRWNLLFLFTIVSLPYMTRMLGRSGDLQAGTVLYAADVALVGLSMIAIVAHVRRAGLLRPGVPTARATGTIRAIAIPTAAFALSIPIAFANTTLAEYSWLVLAVGGNFASIAVRRFAAARSHGSEGP